MSLVILGVLLYVVRVMIWLLVFFQVIQIRVFAMVGGVSRGTMLKMPVVVVFLPVVRDLCSIVVAVIGVFVAPVMRVNLVILVVGVRSGKCCGDHAYTKQAE
jgi:hypothetical protein